MQAFFDPQVSAHFVAYSFPHIAALAILTLLACAMFFWRTAIAKRPAWKATIRYGLLLCLVLPEIVLYGWYAAEGLWNVKYTLPLELCNLSQLLAILLLITRHRLLYPLVFFAGIGGALQAVFTPDLGYPFPHFRFFHFFIVHSAIILAALYVTWIERSRPTRKSIGIAMLFLNLLAVVVGAVDYALGANYMFLRHKPEGGSLLSLLGPYPYYILVEEGIALLTFTLLYLPFALRRPGSRN